MNKRKILIFKGTLSRQENFKLLLKRYLYIVLAEQTRFFLCISPCKNIITLLPLSFKYKLEILAKKSISLKYLGHVHLKQSVGIKKMARPISCSVNTVVRQHNQMEQIGFLVCDRSVADQVT